MSTQQQPVLSSWSTLETFDVEVSSPSNRLYRNGRQQVEVTVKLRARDSEGKIVPLAEAQKQSVRLIDYNSGEELPNVPASGAVTSGWGTTAKRNEYEFFPGTREGYDDAEGSSEGYAFVVRYLQTVDASPKRIGALIRRDAQTVFRTNADNVQKSIEAVPERLPSYDEHTMSVEHTWEAQRVSGGENDWDLRTVDYYFCGLSFNGNRVKLREFAVRPASMFQWESTNPTSELFSFTGFGAPGSATAVYDVPAAFNDRKNSPITMPSDGRGVVILIRSNNITQSSAGNVRKAPCDVDALDEFGNEHALRVSFKSSTNRNELVLTRR